MTTTFHVEGRDGAAIIDGEYAAAARRDRVGVLIIKRETTYGSIFIQRDRDRRGDVTKKISVSRHSIGHSIILPVCGISPAAISAGPNRPRLKVIDSQDDLGVGRIVKNSAYSPTASIHRKTVFDGEIIQRRAVVIDQDVIADSHIPVSVEIDRSEEHT